MPWLRIPYGLGVACLMVALVWRSAPAAVGWMSNETLSIYLWHLPIVHALLPWTETWPAALRIPLVAGAAIAITAGGTAAVRLLSGYASAQIYALSQHQWQAPAARQWTPDGVG